ncbi:MAG TPA: VOC family protein [Blastocatellia bacterium]|nr:VOC family protein [Blastocatellia bacterium]
MITLRVDHVTIAGHDLAALESAFARLRLGTVYGGMHSNGVTHMSVLGFDDGSYMELISTKDKDKRSPLWGDYISGDAGICAWAVEADDVSGEVSRLSAKGLTVNGPVYMSRQRPDGKTAEWDLAFVGAHEPGAKFPFIIKDRTPRGLRVEPTESVSGTELTGIGKIILGVADMSSSAESFRHAYDLYEPSITDDEEFGARLADFEGSPVMLAAPLGDEGWLLDRLNRFGELPCGMLIRTVDMEKTIRRFNVAREPDRQGRIAWLSADAFNGTRIGFTP